MKNRDTLKHKIESFSKLEKNWGSYNEEQITGESIITANKVLDALPDIIDIQKVHVFPMRDGGVQIQIGEYKEIEIFNYTVTEIEFDINLNIEHLIVNKYVYELY
jgi:hypothetical protein